MSYILDALKKLEKERKRGNVPDILTTQELNLKEKKKRIIWPYLVMAVLLLNAVLLVWWISPWETEKSDSISKRVTDKSFKSKTTDTALIEKTKAVNDEGSFENEKTMTKIETDFRNTRKESDNSKRLLSEKNNLENKVSKNTPSASDTNKSKELNLASKNIQGVEKENSVTPSTDVIMEPPLKNKIYKLEELPLEIKQKVPPLKITISLYSDDPASRMAKINDMMLREGQYLSTGLKLEEITPDGIIFNYQNYRFLIGLK